MTAPVIHCHGPSADEAWAEHRALLKALRDAPTLANRPHFTALRMDAFERFSNAFEVAK